MFALMKSKLKLAISVIVPAYNEEKTVGRVLNQLKKSPSISEIIAINDGSTDNTLLQMQRVPGVILLDFKKNRGKAHAVAAGITKAHGEIIMLIDADAMTIDDLMISRMIKPLLEKVADGVIGYPDTIIDKFFIPLCGQRAYFRADLLPHLDSFEKKGYGLELYLNYIYHGKKIEHVVLSGLQLPQKHKKQSLDMATKMYLVELLEIMHEIAKSDKPADFFNKAYLQPFKKLNSGNDDFSARNLLKKLKNRVNQ